MTEPMKLQSTCTPRSVLFRTEKRTATMRMQRTSQCFRWHDPMKGTASGRVLLIRSERRGGEIPGGIAEQGEALLREEGMPA